MPPAACSWLLRTSIEGWNGFDTITFCTRRRARFANVAVAFSLLLPRRLCQIANCRVAAAGATVYHDSSRALLRVRVPPRAPLVLAFGAHSQGISLSGIIRRFLFLSLLIAKILALYILRTADFFERL